MTERSLNEVLESVREWQRKPKDIKQSEKEKIKDVKPKNPEKPSNIIGGRDRSE